MNKKKRNCQLSAYGYITPILLIMIVFLGVSVLMSVVLSFTKYNILTPPQFDELDNYTRMLTDKKFVKALMNTLKVMVYIVPLQTVISLLVSVVIASKRNTWLGKLANIVIFIPVLSSNAVVGTVWKAILNGHIEVVEKFFAFFGINCSMLLGDADSALLTVAMVSIWKNVGYYAVLYISALINISDHYYEAAKVDGAGRISRFFYVTLPMLKPTTILVVFLGVTTSLQCFDIIYNLTGGGPAMGTTTLVFYVYDLCFKSGRAGYAMAVSNMLFLLILITVVAQRKMMRKDASEI
ncbi:sugar ABC transporter permease [Dorea phocaeensis]|uniref:Sugar ABC transporter permease n=1 Tax=Dorea phocaeensis TaxID=2040291 RepID=A0A850HFM0_9FIRM|nr:sugar ABC transporter permease [Dorea phocaeensis]NSK13807.1 sugar ABC transporter permease [Dorea phocaeensis]NVH57062.1 sugar ABC transporter permease [Dorea phocaeensis]